MPEDPIAFLPNPEVKKCLALASRAGINVSEILNAALLANLPSIDDVLKSRLEKNR
jgi:hypothetical protein